MADDKVALEIFIEADKAQMSLGDLEKGFDSMKERLKEVGRGSKEFKTLSTAMANTSLEIQNVEASFEALDSNAVAGEMGALAGGIGDITASLVLMGGENETIQQIGASIEKAMAISMGFKGAIESVSAATKIYTDLQNKGKIATIAKSVAEKAAAAGTWLLAGAQTALNAIMSANPIALIVLAAAGLVTAFVALGGSIMGLIDTALKPFQFAIDMVVDALQFLGIMESDSAIATREAEEAKAAAVKKASEEKIKEYERQITELKKLQKAHKELSDKVIGDMEFEVKMLKAKGEKSVLAEFNLLKEKKKIANERHILIYNELQAAIARDKEMMKLNGTVLVSERKKIEELAKLNTEAFEETKKADQEIELYRATYNKGVQDRIDKEAAASKKRWEAGAADRAMARDKESQAKKDALMEDIELDEKKATLRENEINATDEFTNNLIELDKSLDFQKDQSHLKELARIDEEKAARDEARQLAFDLTLHTLNEISNVSNAYADRDLKAEEDRFNNLRATKQLTEKQLAAEELKSAGIKDKIRKKQFENDKKMQIAMAAINGAQALTSIFAQYPKFDGGFAMVAALATSVITTAASIAKIKATTFSSTPMPALPTLDSGDGGAGGASTAAGGAAITPVSNTSTILGNQQIFVTETDITNTQNNVSVIEESATF